MSQSHPLKIITRIPLPPPTPPSALLSALHAYVPLIAANPYLKTYISLPLPPSSSPSPSPPADPSLPTPPSLTDDPHFFLPPGPDGYNPKSYLITDSVPLLPLPDWLGGGSLLGTKQVSVPCTFQSFGYGVRCKAVAAAGVVVRSSYEVRHRYRPRRPQGEQGHGQSVGGQVKVGAGQGEGHGQQDREEAVAGLGQGLRAGLRKGGPDDIAHKNNNDDDGGKGGGGGGGKLINKVTGTSIENYEYELVEIATVECPAIVRPFVKAKFEKGHQEVLQAVVDQVVAGWMEELRSFKRSGAASGQGRGRTLLQEIQQQT
ncbi:hypothetical protein QBC32DRAFT_330388 [Pseudoneurospora amorphoporcata]|uniref:DUF7053 domain-containing protein n=1 Tax=Pseudoneurospora amorphoporcata TaxID=241081 RepID=A0AAN6P2R0_9PEZI|nr:hypothetical protein QBC32DRAFT_330388 [Pseudoneurospora amorphoporcata]